MTFLKRIQIAVGAFLLLQMSMFSLFFTLFVVLPHTTITYVAGDVPMGKDHCRGIYACKQMPLSAAFSEPAGFYLGIDLLNLTKGLEPGVQYGIPYHDSLNVFNKLRQELSKVFKRADEEPLLRFFEDMNEAFMSKQKYGLSILKGQSLAGKPRYYLELHLAQEALKLLGNSEFHYQEGDIELNVFSNDFYVPARYGDTISRKKSNVIYMRRAHTDMRVKSNSAALFVGDTNTDQISGDANGKNGRAFFKASSGRSSGGFSSSATDNNPFSQSFADSDGLKSGRNSQGESSSLDDLLDNPFVSRRLSGTVTCIGAAHGEVLYVHAKLFFNSASLETLDRPFLDKIDEDIRCFRIRRRDEHSCDKGNYFCRDGSNPKGEHDGTIIAGLQNVKRKRFINKETGTSFDEYGWTEERFADMKESLATIQKSIDESFESGTDGSESGTDDSLVSTTSSDDASVAADGSSTHNNADSTDPKKTKVVYEPFMTHPQWRSTGRGRPLFFRYSGFKNDVCDLEHPGSVVDNFGHHQSLHIRDGQRFSNFAQATRRKNKTLSEDEHFLMAFRGSPKKRGWAQFNPSKPFASILSMNIQCPVSHAGYGIFLNGAIGNSDRHVWNPVDQVMRNELYRIDLRKPNSTEPVTVSAPLLLPAGGGLAAGGIGGSVALPGSSAPGSALTIQPPKASVLYDWDVPDLDWSLFSVSSAWYNRILTESTVSEEERHNNIFTPNNFGRLITRIVDTDTKRNYCPKMYQRECVDTEEMFKSYGATSITKCVAECAMRRDCGGIVFRIPRKAKTIRSVFAETMREEGLSFPGVSSPRPGGTPGGGSATSPGGDADGKKGDWNDGWKSAGKYPGSNKDSSSSAIGRFDRSLSPFVECGGLMSWSEITGSWKDGASVAVGGAGTTDVARAFGVEDETPLFGYDSNIYRSYVEQLELFTNNLKTFNPGGALTGTTGGSSPAGLTPGSPTMASTTATSSTLSEELEEANRFWSAFLDQCRFIGATDTGNTSQDPPFHASDEPKSTTLIERISELYVQQVIEGEPEGRALHKSFQDVLKMQKEVATDGETDSKPTPVTSDGKAAVAGDGEISENGDGKPPKADGTPPMEERNLIRDILAKLKNRNGKPTTDVGLLRKYGDILGNLVFPTVSQNIDVDLIWSCLTNDPNTKRLDAIVQKLMREKSIPLEERVGEKENPDLEIIRNQQFYYHGVLVKRNKAANFLDKSRAIYFEDQDLYKDKGYISNVDIGAVMKTSYSGEVVGDPIIPASGISPVNLVTDSYPDIEHNVRNDPRQLKKPTTRLKVNAATNSPYLTEIPIRPRYNELAILSRDTLDLQLHGLYARNRLRVDVAPAILYNKITLIADGNAARKYRTTNVATMNPDAGTIVTKVPIVLPLYDYMELRLVSVFEPYKWKGCGYLTKPKVVDLKSMSVIDKELFDEEDRELSVADSDKKINNHGGVDYRFVILQNGNVWHSEGTAATNMWRLSPSTLKRLRTKIGRLPFDYPTKLTESHMHNTYEIAPPTSNEGEEARETATTQGKFRGTSGPRDSLGPLLKLFDNPIALSSQTVTDLDHFVTLSNDGSDNVFEVSILDKLDSSADPVFLNPSLFSDGSLKKNSWESPLKSDGTGKVQTKKADGGGEAPIRNEIGSGKFAYGAQWDSNVYQKNMITESFKKKSFKKGAAGFAGGDSLPEVVSDKCSTDNFLKNERECGVRELSNLLYPPATPIDCYKCSLRPYPMALMASGPVSSLGFSADGKVSAPGSSAATINLESIVKKLKNKNTNRVLDTAYLKSTPAASGIYEDQLPDPLRQLSTAQGQPLTGLAQGVIEQRGQLRRTRPSIASTQRQLLQTPRTVIGFCDMFLRSFCEVAAGSHFILWDRISVMFKRDRNDLDRRVGHVIDAETLTSEVVEVRGRYYQVVLLLFFVNDKEIMLYLPEDMISLGRFLESDQKESQIDNWFLSSQADVAKAQAAAAAGGVKDKTTLRPWKPIHDRILAEEEAAMGQFSAQVSNLVSPGASKECDELDIDHKISFRFPRPLNRLHTPDQSCVDQISPNNNYISPRVLEHIRFLNQRATSFVPIVENAQNTDFRLKSDPFRFNPDITIVRVPQRRVAMFEDMKSDEGITHIRPILYIRNELLQRSHPAGVWEVSGQDNGMGINYAKDIQDGFIKDTVAMRMTRASPLTTTAFGEPIANYNWPADSAIARSAGSGRKKKVRDVAGLQKTVKALGKRRKEGGPGGATYRSYTASGDDSDGFLGHEEKLFEKNENKLESETSSGRGGSKLRYTNPDTFEARLLSVRPCGFLPVGTRFKILSTEQVRISPTIFRSMRIIRPFRNGVFRESTAYGVYGFNNAMPSAVLGSGVFSDVVFERRLGGNLNPSGTQNVRLVDTKNPNLGNYNDQIGSPPGLNPPPITSTSGFSAAGASSSSGSYIGGILDGGGGVTGYNENVDFLACRLDPRYDVKLMRTLPRPHDVWITDFGITGEFIANPYSISTRKKNYIFQAELGLQKSEALSTSAAASKDGGLGIIAGVEADIAALKAEVLSAISGKSRLNLMPIPPGSSADEAASKIESLKTSIENALLRGVDQGKRMHSTGGVGRHGGFYDFTRDNFQSVEPNTLIRISPWNSDKNPTFQMIGLRHTEISGKLSSDGENFAIPVRWINHLRLLEDTSDLHFRYMGDGKSQNAIQNTQKPVSRDNFGNDLLSSDFGNTRNSEKPFYMDAAMAGTQGLLPGMVVQMKTLSPPNFIEFTYLPALFGGGSQSLEPSLIALQASRARVGGDTKLVIGLKGMEKPMKKGKDGKPLLAVGKDGKSLAGPIALRTEGPPRVRSSKSGFSPLLESSSGISDHSVPPDSFAHAPHDAGSGSHGSAAAPHATDLKRSSPVHGDSDASLKEIPLDAMQKTIPDALKAEKPFAMPPGIPPGTPEEPTAKEGVDPISFAARGVAVAESPPAVDSSSDDSLSDTAPELLSQDLVDDMQRENAISSGAREDFVACVLGEIICIKMDITNRLDFEILEWRANTIVQTKYETLAKVVASGHDLTLPDKTVLRILGSTSLHADFDPHFLTQILDRFMAQRYSNPISSATAGKKKDTPASGVGAASGARPDVSMDASDIGVISDRIQDSKDIRRWQFSAHDVFTVETQREACTRVRNTMGDTNFAMIGNPRKSPGYVSTSSTADVCRRAYITALIILNPNGFFVSSRTPGTVSSKIKDFVLDGRYQLPGALLLPPTLEPSKVVFLDYNMVSRLEPVSRARAPDSDLLGLWETPYVLISPIHVHSRTTRKSFLMNKVGEVVTMPTYYYPFCNY